MPYLRRFPFARQPWSSFTPDPNEYAKDQQPWYSFDYGNVHFTVISTEHDWLDDGSPQRKWIEADLKAADANRANVPWLLFAGHRPMYVDSTFKGDQIIATYLRSGTTAAGSGQHLAGLEPLLVAYHVDIAIWGHHHTYQRSCASIVNGTCVTKSGVPHGPMHLVIGMAGFKHDKDFNQTKPKMWSCVDMVHYGFATFQFANETHLHGRFINNGFNESTEYSARADASDADAGDDVGMKANVTVDDWWLVRDPAQVQPNRVTEATCIKTPVPTWAPTKSPSGYQHRLPYSFTW